MRYFSLCMHIDRDLSACHGNTQITMPEEWFISRMQRAALHTCWGLSVCTQQSCCTEVRLVQGLGCKAKRCRHLLQLAPCAVGQYHRAVMLSTDPLSLGRLQMLKTGSTIMLSQTGRSLQKGGCPCGGGYWVRRAQRIRRMRCAFHSTLLDCISMHSLDTTSDK